jgi:hypothetical protein
VQNITVESEASLIKYRQTLDSSFELHNSQLEYLDIEIRDLQNNFIDFNNQAWAMTLCFTILKEYDTSSKYNTFSSIIRYGGFQ